MLKDADFCPIIEPVRETLSGLHRALDAIVEFEGRAIVVVNPHHGDLSGQGEPLTELLNQYFRNQPGIAAGILLKAEMTVPDALERFETHAAHRPAFIHAGFREAKTLAEEIQVRREDQSHIFFEKHCGKLYQRHFKDSTRILLRDGFIRMKNREYVHLEHFSDLHATFVDEGMNGFGDFLIVGDEFSETGGPAYAIAIHLTLIDEDQDDSMLIYHFVSDTQDTPRDPAGKFAEALDKMIAEIDKPGSKVLETEAVREFRMLHERGHFPGLGYVKKLSMSHHIETLADYFRVHE